MANYSIAHLEIPAADSGVVGAFYREVFGWKLETNAEHNLHPLCPMVSQHREACHHCAHERQGNAPRRNHAPGLVIRSLPSLLVTGKGAFCTRCLERVHLIIMQMAQVVLLESQSFHLTHEQEANEPPADDLSSEEQGVID
jgi:hypothetical protein